MEHGICTYSLIPLRKEAAEESEMINHILFGEGYEILEEIEKWSKLRLLYDGDIGWIDRKLVCRVNQTDLGLLQSGKYLVNTNQFNVIGGGNTYPLSIMPGSSILNFSGNHLRMNNQDYECVTLPKFLHDVEDMASKVRELAFTFMNAPYLWGGRSLYGIDCSGFTQLVFKMCGIFITRNSYQQIQMGEEIDMKNPVEWRTGDLAFFGKSIEKITHVGFVVDQNKVIHASGRVRVDTLDEKGIFNRERDMYTHKMMGVRRYF